MTAPWTPFRWPNGWKDPSALTLLKGTPIDYLLIAKGAEFDGIRSGAQRAGLRIADPESPPAGIKIIKGEWPGVRMTRGAGGSASAGPTGAAWIDSNGWQIRLASALQPDAVIWVDAVPQANARVTPESYLVATADSAAYGGRWIIALNDQLAEGVLSQQPQALQSWNRVKAAAGFFAERKAWAELNPEAVVGVISDFTGDNEFFGGELLNLLARAGQHYRVVNKKALAPAALQGLRAIIYADAEAPSPALRKQALAFVEAGGTLITTSKWGPVSGPPKGDLHPRYTVRPSGKGSIAMAKTDPDDPWIMANDSVLLVSHRYDLVRFWNGGSTASYYTVSPDRKKGVVHLLLYSNRGPDSASVRIAGRYRNVKVSTVDAPVVQNVAVKPEKDAVEVHLPQVSQYVALELEV
jgi:hypothetical protein